MSCTHDPTRRLWLGPRLNRGWHIAVAYPISPGTSPAIPLPEPTLTDFTYRISGLFATILPETPAGEAEWGREIGPKTAGTGKVLAGADLRAVLADIRRAGYTIRNGRPAMPEAMTPAELLAEVGL